MSEQKTDTSEFRLLDEGFYEFTVSKPPEKRRGKSGKGEYFLWNFTYVEGGETQKFRTVLLPNQMGELLSALGAIEESPNIYKWDDEEVVNKTIACEIVHEEGSDGKTRERLRDIQSVDSKEVPQQKKAGEIPPENIAWDE